MSSIVKPKRARWGEGPWNQEPDRDEFITAVGLPALLLRSRTGAWCGYVGVPKDHEKYKADADDLDAHGGITFCGWRDQPEGTVSEEFWWFGFDCGHAWDISPQLGNMGIPDAKYRDIGYVRDECEKLAVQLSGPKRLTE